MQAWTLPASIARQRLAFVPLTPELAHAFYGDQLPRTVKGYALTAEGKPVVVIGLLRDPYRWVLFSDTHAAARGDPNFTAKRWAVRGMRQLRDLLNRTNAPVHARPDTSFHGAERVLEHLGFRHLHQGIYEWQASPPQSR